MGRHFQFIMAIIILLVADFSYGQGDRKFKGRIILSNANQGSVNGIAVRLINQGQGTTGTDGIFEIAINDKLNSVTIELVKSQWSILYPPKGVIGVPKGENEVVEIIIGKSSEQILTKAQAERDKELRKNFERMGIKQDSINRTVSAIHEDLTKKINDESDSLEKRKVLANKRQQFFPQFSATINNYINEAKDLKDAFKFSTEHALDDNAALKLLEDEIKGYNLAYEDLNSKYTGYKAILNELWEKEPISAANLLDNALRVHAERIRPLTLKINDINDYNLRRCAVSKKQCKENIKNSIKTLDFQLEESLNLLDKQAQELLAKLSA